MLKKLRFREILKENMRSPEELLESADDETNAAARHIGEETENMFSLWFTWVTQI